MKHWAEMEFPKFLILVQGDKEARVFLPSKEFIDMASGCHKNKPVAIKRDECKEGNNETTKVENNEANMEHTKSIDHLNE